MLSVRREKYDTSVVWMSSPSGVSRGGWTAPTASVRRYEDLPREAQAYIARIEQITGVPAAILSTGSAREDTIIRGDSIAAQWFR